MDNSYNYICSMDFTNNRHDLSVFVIYSLQDKQIIKTGKIDLRNISAEEFNQEREKFLTGIKNKYKNILITKETR